MSTFYIVQGDRLPALTATLKQGIGTSSETVINLTGATVTFTMTNEADNTVKVSLQSVTVVSAVAGTVSYAWGATDTDTVGKYFGEFKVTYSGSALTVPSIAPDEIVIRAKLA